MFRSKLSDSIKEKINNPDSQFMSDPDSLIATILLEKLDCLVFPVPSNVLEKIQVLKNSTMNIFPCEDIYYLDDAIILVQKFQESGVFKFH